MIATTIHKMTYQLVLQWPGSSLKGYHDLIEIENTLLSSLDERHSVDGHDAGSGEANILIHTDDPRDAFKQIVDILGSRDFWVDARVAYRKSGGGDYTILWPEGLREFHVK
jgi:hypothetical protein